MKGKKVLALLLSLVMVFGLCSVAVFAEGTGVAEINGTKYASLADALWDVPYDGTATTIKMIADSAYDSAYVDEGQNVILDLNGKTLNVEEYTWDGYYYYPVIVYGSLTVQDSTATSGKITNSSDTAAVFVGTDGSFTLESGRVEAPNAEYTICTSASGSSTVNVNGGTITGNMGIAAFGTSTVNVTDGVISAEQTGIAVNGSTSNATINISGGTINSNANGIYLTSGELNVTGGTITGYTGIYQKSGTLNISGGTITGNGAKTDYEYKGSGSVATGDALVIDNCGYPGGEPVVNITGGAFVSENADAVGSYYGGTATAAVTGFVSGGTFNTEVPADYVANGFVSVANSVVASGSVAMVNGVGYATLAEAIAAVPTNGAETTITMLADETIEGNAGVTIAAGKNVVLDLNGHTVKNNVNESKGSQVITNNGTLTVKDTSVAQTGKITNAAAQGVNVGDWWSTPQYNYVTNVITNKGTLNVEGGTIENTASGSICYAIDNNSTSSNAIINISGGNIVNSHYTTVRMYCNSTTYENKLNQTGGTIVAAKAALWIHLPGSDTSKAVKASLNVSGGEMKATGHSDVYDDTPYAFYDYSFGNSFANANYEITDGNFTGEVYSDGVTGFISGGTFNTPVPAKYCAEGFEPKDNGNGTYGVQPETPAVAQISNTKYKSLAAAFAAANELENATVTLLRDYDMEANEPGYGYTTLSHSARNNMIEIGDGVTFDLNGHTLSNLFNNTFNVTGNNVTVQNGEMRVGNYTNGTTCSYILYVSGAQNFVVNNLTTFGGINVAGGSTAKINNLSFSGTTFYAVCAQEGSEVTLNGGSYNKAITGSANYLFWVENGSTMNITGGTYTKGTTTFINGKNPVITGGIFDFDPTNKGVAEGYETVLLDSGENEGKYQVGKIQASAIEPAGEVNEGYDATYTATKEVISTDGENTVLSDGASITVNVKAQGNAVSENSAVNYNLGSVVTEALAAAQANDTTLNVEIAIVSDNGTTGGDATVPTITYEVHPEATVKSGNTVVGTFNVENSQLAGSANFTIKLYVPEEIRKAATSGYVKVKHVHTDGSVDDIVDNLSIDEGGYVTITGISTFSEFELVPVPSSSTGDLYVLQSLDLASRIGINLYVKNTLTDNTTSTANYTISYRLFDGNYVQKTLSGTELLASGYYKIAIGTFDAKQMTDVVYVSIENEYGVQVFSREYSIKGYCDAVINAAPGTYDDKLVNLCKATLDYGTYAQKYFNYRPYELANNGSDYFSLSYVDEEFAGVDYGYALKALNLESQVQLIFYFESVSAGDISVTAENSEFTGWAYDVSNLASGYTKVTISGIPSGKLNEAFNVTVNGGYSGKWSAMSFAYAAQNTGTMGDLSRALANYYNYASVYFN